MRREAWVTGFSLTSICFNVLYRDFLNLPTLERLPPHLAQKFLYFLINEKKIPFDFYLLSYLSRLKLRIYQLRLDLLSIPTDQCSSVSSTDWINVIFHFSHSLSELVIPVDRFVPHWKHFLRSLFRMSSLTTKLKLVRLSFKSECKDNRYAVSYRQLLFCMDSLKDTLKELDISGLDVTFPSVAFEGCKKLRAVTFNEDAQSFLDALQKKNRKCNFSIVP